MMMEARVATHWPHTTPHCHTSECVCWCHHASLVSLNVVDVVVVAYTMEWMKQGHACGVPPITVSLVYVCRIRC